MVLSEERSPEQNYIECEAKDATRVRLIFDARDPGARQSFRKTPQFYQALFRGSFRADVNEEDCQIMIYPNDGAHISAISEKMFVKPLCTFVFEKEI